jgi:AcrR family transcriptional regulator
MTVSCLFLTSTLPSTSVRSGTHGNILLTVRQQAAKRLPPAQRRAQVLEAARTVFARDGFAGGSAAAVAREAGVTRSLVHHYFASRRKLFLAVLEELAERLPAAIRTDLVGLPLDEVVRTNAASLLDAVERDRDAWVALLATAGADPDVEQILDRARDRAIDKMLVNQRAALGDVPELRLVLRVYLGAAEAALAEWTVHQRATRAQAEMIVRETLLAMVAEVLPRLADEED